MTAQPDQTAADTPTAPPVPYPDLDREGRFRAVGQYYENRAVRCWEITCRGHLHGGYWDETNQAEPPWAGPNSRLRQGGGAPPHAGRPQRVAKLAVTPT